MNAAPDSFSNGSAAGKGDDATDGTRDSPFVGSFRADGASIPVSTSLDRDQGKPDDPCQDAPTTWRVHQDGPGEAEVEMVCDDAVEIFAYFARLA
ncbi:hypothetical protein G3M48_003207, partial [Beauveria asiatica]